MASKRVADDLARPGIEDEGEIGEAGGDGDISDAAQALFSLAAVLARLALSDRKTPTSKPTGRLPDAAAD